MTNFALLLMVFFIFPCVFGVVAFYSDAYKVRALSNSYRRHGWYWLVAISSWLSILFLLFSYFLVGYEGVFVKVAVIVSSVSGVVLVLKEFRVFELIKSHPKFSTVIFGVFVFSVTIVAKVFVDSEISALTGVNASNLPNAQQYVLLVIAPLFWFVFIIVAFIPVYFFYAILIALKSVGSRSKVGRFLRSFAIILNIRYRVSESDPFFDFPRLFGMAFLLTLTPAIVFEYPKSKGFVEDIEKLVVFSSYYPVGDHCNNLESDSLVSFLSRNLVSIAKTDESDDYKFAVGICDR